jgi:hypothetical protein
MGRRGRMRKEKPCRPEIQSRARWAGSGSGRKFWRPSLSVVLSILHRFIKHKYQNWTCTFGIAGNDLLAKPQLSSETLSVCALESRWKSVRVLHQTTYRFFCFLSVDLVLTFDCAAERAQFSFHTKRMTRIWFSPEFIHISSTCRAGVQCTQLGMRKSDRRIGNKRFAKKNAAWHNQEIECSHFHAGRFRSLH